MKYDEVIGQNADMFDLQVTRGSRGAQLGGGAAGGSGPGMEAWWPAW